MKIKGRNLRHRRTIREHQERRDAQVWEIVQEWYEEGRHDRSKRWIYRHKVYPVMPMSERSFFRALERHQRRIRIEED